MQFEIAQLDISQLQTTQGIQNIEQFTRSQHQTTQQPYAKEKLETVGTTKREVLEEMW